MSTTDKTALWDTMAERFRGYEEQTAANNDLIRLLEQKHLLTKDSRVLDLGCAAGKYSFYFAKHCKEVVGVDISSKMLENAEEVKKEQGFFNVTFLKGDWDEMDLDAVGGAGSFDLVFANMTPAVMTEEALQKMMAASRRWCVFGGPAGRKRRVNDGVYQIFGLPLHLRKNEKRVPMVFGNVWTQGYLPEVFYIESHARWEMTTPKAFDYYLTTAQSMLRMQKGSAEVTDSQKEALRALLERLQEHGSVREELDGRNAVLIWNITKKEE